jgi:hypothetical protein
MRHIMAPASQGMIARVPTDSMRETKAALVVSALM